MATPPSPPGSARKPSSTVRIVIGLLAAGCLVPVVTGLWQERMNDLARLAESARAIDPDRPPTNAVGKLVTVTGTLQTKRQIGDSYLQPGPYVTLERRVETWAWAEHLNGTTPAYERVWTANPAPSEGFQQPEGHGNPPRRLGNDHWAAEPLTIGRVTVPQPQWHAERLSLTPAQVRSGRLQDNWIYPAGGDPAKPQVGDARLSYWAIGAGGKVTAIGVLGPHGDLTPYQDDRTRLYAAAGGVLFDVLPADRDGAIKSLWLAYPPQANWPRRLELLGWLFVSLIGWRYVFRRA